MQLTRRLIIPSPDISTKYYLAERVARFVASLTTTSVRKDFPYQQSDLLLALSMALKSGMPVLLALEWLVAISNGKFSELFSNCVAKVELGADLQAELEELAKKYPDPILEDLVQKLSAALSLGIAVGSEIMQLSEVASEQVNQMVAKQAGANETKMLIPTIFLILPVTVLFAVFPSLSMLGIS